MQVGLGFWASKTLLSAIEMEVFTELAGHAEDLNTLQGRLGLHPRSARDFLDALVALGFLQRVNGKYSNTPSTDKFLDRRKPSYVGGILEMANRRLYPFWGNLTAALRTGELQNEAKGGGPNFFAALYADPENLKGFLKAMTGISTGCEPPHRQQVSLEELQDGRGRRHRAGRSDRASCAGQPAPLRHQVSIWRKWRQRLRSTLPPTVSDRASHFGPAVSLSRICPRRMS